MSDVSTNSDAPSQNGGAADDNKATTTSPDLTPKPRDPPSKTQLETYVYRDFGNVDDPSMLLNNGNINSGGISGNNGNDNNNATLQFHGGDGGRLPPQSLQSQKLPSKLGAMLSDPGEYNI